MFRIIITVLCLLICLTVCMELVDKSARNTAKIDSRLIELQQQTRALASKNMLLKLKIDKYQRAKPWSEYLMATLSEIQKMELSISAERLRQQRINY